MQRDEAVEAAVRKHGFSEAAVAVLWDALERGGGRQAQFSHPELGGMGQWSGGMIQIGDMFNAALRARVAAVCEELSLARSTGGGDAAAARPWQEARGRPVGSGNEAGPSRTSVPLVGDGLRSVQPTITAASPDPASRAGHTRSGFGEWWPAAYGSPAATGSQNDLSYAFFPDRSRLLLRRDGCVTVYDTGRHRIVGVSQRQHGDQTVTFTTQFGPLDCESLSRVES